MSKQLLAWGYLDPNKEVAKIRAFFVHPDYARQGLAKQLIDACEKAARESGFKFYRAQGYKGEDKVDYTLPNGLIVKFLPMEKQL